MELHLLFYVNHLPKLGKNPAVFQELSGVSSVLSYGLARVHLVLFCPFGSLLRLYNAFVYASEQTYKVTCVISWHDLVYYIWGNALYGRKAIEGHIAFFNKFFLSF